LNRSVAAAGLPKRPDHPPTPPVSPAGFFFHDDNVMLLPAGWLASNELQCSPTNIAAMREARAGNLKSFDSVTALMADLHAED
jgi:hypothetical protein